MRERSSTIVRLEEVVAAGYAGTEQKRKKLAELAASLDPPDVPASVPIAARLFVSRVRSMCHGLRGAKPARHFAQCHNNECCRLFYKGERAAEESSSMAHDCVPEHERLYWAACAEAPLYGADRDRFCSAACAAQWWVHWRRLMPPGDNVANQSNEAEDCAQCLRRTELRRVVAAFDVAIARNAASARAVRKRRRRHRRNARAVSRADANREFDARLTKLNVDTGLLYAASVALKVPSLVRNRALPGTAPCWRANGHEHHRNALLRVARLYRQHPESVPIANLLEVPTFFRAIRTRIVHIF